MTDEIEVERYELSRPPSYRFEIERRDFMRIFAVLGGGLLVASVSDAGAQQESGGGGRGSVSGDVAAWIHVDAAGRITGYTGKTEIGQNIRTSLAQAIADELRVPMAMVALTMADTDLVPFDQGTFGSLSTPRMAPVLARAAVTAREMLIDRAAALWSVDRGTLTCKDARITAAGRSIGFGDLVKDRKLAGIVPADAPVSPAAAWTVRGTAARKANGRSFVTGEHRFTPDITRPGMMYGRVIRSDGYSGTLVSFDDAAARALGGVVVVRDGDFAGVVAPTERLARRAAAAIRAEWRLPAGQPSSATIYEHLKRLGHRAADAAAPRFRPATSPLRGRGPSARSTSAIASLTSHTFRSSRALPSRSGRMASSPCGPVRSGRSASAPSWRRRFTCRKSASASSCRTPGLHMAASTAASTP